MLADRSPCVILNAVGTTGTGTLNAGATAVAGGTRWHAAAVSTTTLVVGLLFGEMVIVALTGLSRHLAGGANVVAWLLATAINAVLGFSLLGLPQLRAWEKGTARPAANDDDLTDPRVRLAARSLSAGGQVAFVVASVIGGPIAVGWFYGRRRDPRARSLTWTAAWLCSAVFSALYLGLLAWIF